LLCAVFLLAARPGQGQTLSQFLDAAATSNVDVRESAFIGQQRHREAQEAWSRFLPTIALQASWTNNQYSAIARLALTPGAPPERLVLVPPNNLTASLTANVPLIDPPGWAQSASAKAVWDAARAQERATGLDVQREVIQGFYNLLGARKLAVAAQESIHASEIEAGQTNERVRAGVASPVDAARAMAELEAKRQSLASSGEDVATASETLLRLTSLPPRELVEPPSQGLVEEAPEDGWIRTGLAGLPAIRAAEADLRASEAHARALMWAFIPTLAGSASEQATNATGFTGEPFSYALGLALSERFDMASFRLAQAASAAAEAARVRVQRARENAREQIVRDWERVHTLIARVRAAAAEREANTTAFSMVRDRYRAGTASSLDLNIADRELFNSDANLIQSEALLSAARANLRLSAGLPWDAPGPVAGTP
jgi:outer membrane protein TolC